MKKDNSLAIINENRMFKTRFFVTYIVEGYINRAKNNKVFCFQNMLAVKDLETSRRIMPKIVCVKRTLSDSIYIEADINRDKINKAFNAGKCCWPEVWSESVSIRQIKYV
jgi:hypothetical protein